MPRSEVIEAGALVNTPIRRGRREEIMEIIGNIADNFALSADMPPTIVIGASAVRDVLMPPDATTPKGTILTIISNSITTTGVLTLKTSADAALTPAVTIAQFATVEMIHLGGTGGRGWRRHGG